MSTSRYLVHFTLKIEGGGVIGSYANALRQAHQQLEAEHLHCSQPPGAAQQPQRLRPRQRARLSVQALQGGLPCKVPRVRADAYRVG